MQPDHETHTERDAARFEADRDHGPDLDGHEEDGIPWDNPRRVIDPVGVLGDAIREAMRRRGEVA